MWNARPENRQLPSLLQWLQIRWWTGKRTWTQPQRLMMQQASRYQTVRGLIAAGFLAALVLMGFEIRSRVDERNKATHAARLVQALLYAEIDQVPGILAEIEPYRRWVDPMLKEKHAQLDDDSSQKLHTSLALLPVDPNERNYLVKRLLDASPQELPVIRDALIPYKAELLDTLWAVVEAPQNGKDSQRLRGSMRISDVCSPRSTVVEGAAANRQ